MSKIDEIEKEFRKELARRDSSDGHDGVFANKYERLFVKLFAELSKNKASNQSLACSVCALAEKEYKDSEVLIFKVGKYYKHNSGEMIHIVGSCKTTLYGWCLLAESSSGSDFKPIGQSPDNTQNWEESTEKEWMKNFSK